MLVMPLLLLIGTVGASGAGSRHTISKHDQSHNNAMPQASAAERAVTNEIGMPSAKLEERLDRDVSMDVDYQDPRPRYRFEYGVRDETTGDYKSHYEQRDGEYVQGHYELLEPDGRTLRSVHYSSGGAAGGFVATVSRIPTNGETQDTIPEPTGYSSEGEGRPSTEISNHKEKLTHVKKKAIHRYNGEKNPEMDDSYQDEQQNHRDLGEGKIAHPREKNESGKTYRVTKGSKDQMDYTNYYTSRNPTGQVHQEYDKNLGYNQNKYVAGESVDEENSGKPDNRGKTSENGKSNQVVKYRYEEEPKHEGKYAESYGYSGREYGKSAMDEKKMYEEEGKHDGKNFDDHGSDGQNYNDGRDFYGDGEDSSEVKDYDSEYNYWEKLPYDNDDNSDSTNKDLRDKRHYYEFDEHSGVSENDKSPYSDNEDLRESRPHYEYDESNGSSENSNKGTNHYSDYEDLSDKRPHYRYEENSGSSYSKDARHYGDDENHSDKRPHYDYDENSGSSENNKGTNHYSDYEDLSDNRPYNGYDESNGNSYSDASHYSNDGYQSDKRRPFDHNENSENSENGSNHYSDGKFREESPNYEIHGNGGNSERDEPRKPIHRGGQTKQYNDYEDRTYSSKQTYNVNNASQYGHENRKLKEKRLQSPKQLRGTTSQQKDNNGKRYEAVKPVRENVEEPALTENPNKLQQVQAPATVNRTRKGRGRGKRVGLATSYMNYGKTRANARVRQQLISMLYSKTNENGSSVKEHKSDPKKKLGKRENLTQNRSKIVKKESPSDDPVSYRSTSYWGYQS